MTKQQLREKAEALGMTIGQFLRQPAITRWYGVKADESPPGDGKPAK